jgi:misacylated tRNA(Ala) deacylase
MDRFYGCGRCISAHVEKKKSKCDYNFDHELTEDERRSIESKVNEVIQANLPVSEEFLSRSEAAERYNLNKVPESAGDRIRIVKIGDYDACPCIGPHVQKTSAIGVFHIISTNFENGALRIRFRLSER